MFLHVWYVESSSHSMRLNIMWSWVLRQQPGGLCDHGGGDDGDPELINKVK